MTEPNGTEPTEQVPLEVVIQVAQRADGIVAVAVKATRPIALAEVLELLDMAKQKSLTDSAHAAPARPDITVVRAMPRGIS